MNIILQLIGGIFYLLNKIFLSISERRRNKNKEEESKKWRIASWIVFLIGLPAWVIIFIIERNWIATSLEVAGIPSIILGLLISIKGSYQKNIKWLDYLALICIPIGFGYSIYDFNGLNTLNQWLEIVLILGFLVGTYLLAKREPTGYLWYVFMHISCGWLMWVQNYPWLLLQQIISLGFVIDAYYSTHKRKTKPAQA